jgi:hypothetical protein
MAGSQHAKDFLLADETSFSPSLSVMRQRLDHSPTKFIKLQRLDVQRINLSFRLRMLLPQVPKTEKGQILGVWPFATELVSQLSRLPEELAVGGGTGSSE